jgi:hypothetical protein
MNADSETESIYVVIHNTDFVTDFRFTLFVLKIFKLLITDYIVDYSNDNSDRYLVTI